MTDRELLELAAKAAGYKFYWMTGDGWLETDSPLSDKRWNPLTDDGDALCLAVKLLIDVYPGDGASFARMPYGGRSCSEPHDIGCPYAATRRAIVRAAAEIGRNMK